MYPAVKRGVDDKDYRKPHQSKEKKEKREVE